MLLLEAGLDPEDDDYRRARLPRPGERGPGHELAVLRAPLRRPAQQAARDSKYVAEQDGVSTRAPGTLGGCTAHNAMITVYPHDATGTASPRLTGDRARGRARGCAAASSGSSAAPTRAARRRSPATRGWPGCWRRCRSSATGTSTAAGTASTAGCTPRSPTPRSRCATRSCSRRAQVAPQCAACADFLQPRRSTPFEGLSSAGRPQRLAGRPAERPRGAVADPDRGPRSGAQRRAGTDPATSSERHPDRLDVRTGALVTPGAARRRDGDRSPSAWSTSPQPHAYRADPQAAGGPTRRRSHGAARARGDPRAPAPSTPRSC